MTWNEWLAQWTPSNVLALAGSLVALTSVLLTGILAIIGRRSDRTERRKAEYRHWRETGAPAVGKAYAFVRHQPKATILMNQWQRLSDDERHAFMAASNARIEGLMEPLVTIGIGHPDRLVRSRARESVDALRVIGGSITIVILCLLNGRTEEATDQARELDQWLIDGQKSLVYLTNAMHEDHSVVVFSSDSDETPDRPRDEKGGSFTDPGKAPV